MKKVQIAAQLFAAQKILFQYVFLKNIFSYQLVMKKISTASIVVFLLTGCHVGQLTTFYTDKTSFEEKGVRYDAQHLPITGLYHKYTDKMQLVEETHYVDGRLNGQQKIYEDGKIALIAYYKKGKLNNDFITFYPSGQKKEVFTYQMGKLDGSFLAYYEDGDLMAKGSYAKGMKNGLFEEYYPNGAIKNSVTYLNGKLNGPSRFYTSDNHLITYAEYVDGLRHGAAFSYYKNEKPKILSYRQNDKLEGISKEFDAKGNLKALVTYQNNKEIKRVQF